MATNGASAAHDHSAEHSTPLFATAVAAIGVVFGDIGTSPLYTLQIATETQGTALARADVFGVISLVLWALILAVTIKYVMFVMRADNRGEGGILALLALLPAKKTAEPRVPIIAIFVVAGAALLFGDGMITPAISVLSALEGIEIAAPHLRAYVVPLTCLVLLGLFAIQRRGTGSVGRYFGPVMILWFLTIGALGAKEIVKYPAIVGALSPYWGALYFARHGLPGLSILGVVVLAITGGEALYADMGHFGARPIRVAWFLLCFPALALAYLGQGALILRDPRALANPFFAMVPTGAPTYALVVLAAMATTIASQALISGVFSLTHQAVQLGYFPRVTVRHTSRDAEGQIYVPLLNWWLMFASLSLVLAFKASARLAAAYGIAVSGTMAITSVVFYQVMRTTWRWPAARAVPILVLFLSFDLPFFGANLLKFFDGGYIPILAGALFFAVMIDWRVGRQVLRETLSARSTPLDAFLATLSSSGVARVPGTAVYLSATDGVPYVLQLQTARVRSLMERVILVTVVIEHQPQFDASKRSEVTALSQGFWRVVIHFGYMEHPQVPPALEEALRAAGAPLSNDLTYYIGRETYIGGRGGKMMPLAEGFFALLSRNAKSPVDYFGLPPEGVVELGTRIDL